jgi:hypothetical protein
MKVILNLITAIFISTVAVFAQGFEVKTTGEQTFSFEDKYGRNRCTRKCHFRCK